MAREDNVRVSDADRDAIAAQLREHYAQGRLTMDELNQRLELTFTAKTRTDLNAVTRDLPYVAPTGPLPSDRARPGGHGSSGSRWDSSSWATQGWATQGWGSQGWGSQGWGSQGWGSQGWGSQGWGSQGWGRGYGWTGSGPGAGGPRPGSPAAFLRFIPLLMSVAICLLVLSALGFGFGSGAWLWVIVLGALAALRRLFGWRRGGPRVPFPFRRCGRRRW